MGLLTPGTAVLVGQENTVVTRTAEVRGNYRAVVRRCPKDG
jgi:hypothetical protein